MTRAVCHDLGPGPAPEELARRAAVRPGLVVLRGRFADGAAVLTSHPLRTVAELPPEQDGCAPLTVDGVDAVAGGWFGVAGHDRRSTRWSHHDHVVRRVAGRWRFEALWTPARDGDLARLRGEWQRLIAGPDATGTAATSAWTVPERDPHLVAVERAIELIRAGELYQVNVCTRLSATLHGDPVHLFAAAARELDPAYGAYLPGVLCLSPELFLRRRGRTLTSAPIKGTSPVGAQQAQRLRRSVKDVAENVMIVDLVRNDLGRVCETGSVRPVRLLEVAERVGVLHLVSTVEGTVREGVGDGAVLRALLAPASVTGTPKRRALEAIAALETRSRGAHTGAVGFLSPCWGAELAVAIRTLEVRGSRVEFGVGGGITVDSVPDAEWQECLHKARPVVRAVGGSLPVPEAEDDGPGDLLETVLAVDGRPLRVADHLARLGTSSRELLGRALPPDLAARIAAAPRDLPGRAAVRVIARADGRVDVTARPAAQPPAATHLRTASRPPGRWRHKWADRSWARPDTLYVDGGTVLETERGNVFLLGADGTLVTPPLRPDLLPGVTRRALLDLARDTGRRTELRGFDVPEVQRSVAFWTSSLSGAVPIGSVDGVALPRDDEAVAAVAALLRG